MEKYKPIDNNQGSQARFDSNGILVINGNSFGLPGTTDSARSVLLPFESESDLPLSSNSIVEVVRIIASGNSYSQNEILCPLFNDYLLTGNKIVNVTFDQEYTDRLVLTTYLPTAGLVPTDDLPSLADAIIGTTYGTSRIIIPTSVPLEIIDPMRILLKEFTDFINEGVLKSGVPAKRIMEEVYYSDIADLSTSVDIVSDQQEVNEDVCISGTEIGDNKLTVFGQEVTMGVSDLVELGTKNLNPGDFIRVLVVAVIDNESPYESFIAPKIMIPEDEPITYSYKIRFNNSQPSEYIISITVSADSLIIESSSDSVFIGIKSVYKLS